MGEGKHQLVKPEDSDLTLEICRRSSALQTSAYFNQDNQHPLERMDGLKAYRNGAPGFTFQGV